MLIAEARPSPPLGQPGWIYELKFDGYRLMASAWDGHVQLATRQRTRATSWFPEVAKGLSTLTGGPYILDGEVCVLDELGRSDFDRLQTRRRHRRWYEGCDAVVFCAFDLLARNGRSLIGLPIEERKRQLHELLCRAPACVLFVGYSDAQDSHELFDRAVNELRLEGLVAKRLGSRYRPGERTTDWVKLKREGWQDRSVLRG